MRAFAVEIAGMAGVPIPLPAKAGAFLARSDPKVSFRSSAPGSGCLRGVQQPALIMGQQDPEAPQGLRRTTMHPELRDVALLVRANEVESPAGAGRVTPGCEGVGEAAANPERMAAASDLQGIETGQLLVDNPPGQRLRRLLEQRIRSRPDENR